MNEKTIYEILVKEFLDAELKFSGLEKKVFHRKKYKGKRGLEHEFDVAFEFSGVVDMLIVVECKQLKNKATKQDMEIFASRLDDISAHKGIFVTTVGFDKGAIEIAEVDKIALYQVKDAMNKRRMLGFSTGVDNSGHYYPKCNIQKLISEYPQLNNVSNQLLNTILKGEIEADKYVDFGEAKYYEGNSRDILNPSFEFSEKAYYLENLHQHKFNLSTIISLTILETYKYLSI